MISGLGAAAVAEFDHVLCNQARKVRKRSVFVSVCIVWISIYMCIFGMTKQIAIALHKWLLLAVASHSHSHMQTQQQCCIIRSLNWTRRFLVIFWFVLSHVKRHDGIQTHWTSRQLSTKHECCTNTFKSAARMYVCLYMYWTAAAASHAHNASHRNAYVFFRVVVCVFLSRILFFMRSRLFVVCGYLWYLSLYRASLHIVYKARQQQQNELTKYRLMLLRVRWVLAQWATQSVVFSVSGRRPIYYSIRQKKKNNNNNNNKSFAIFFLFFK